MSQTLEQSILNVNEKYDVVGGTIVLFDKNKINKITNWGNSNLEFNTPITDNTVFRVASISKTITALAFMQLVEQKKIELDEDVSKFLGFEFRNPYVIDIPITPRMLLSHTSGLQDDVEVYDKFLNMSYEINPSPNISKLLNKNGDFFSKSIFLDKKPGSYFNYSNLNY
jgi:CubicO group peptidase (beta-lactamase class C family)